MNPSNHILKRFAELESEIPRLERSDGSEDTAQWHSWATRVMSLLHDAFSPKSVYYKHFDEIYQYHSELNGLEDAVGAFRAAKSDYKAGHALNAMLSNPESGNDKPPCIFIGHEGNKLWAQLKIYLEDELHLKTVFYESEARAGLSIVPVLNKMLDQATFAVLILTAEDETADGKIRARQNVVHEAGLFQGRLSFERAILLVQDGIDGFSNVDGLQHIPFKGDEIQQAFYELGRTLRREQQIT